MAETRRPGDTVTFDIPTFKADGITPITALAVNATGVIDRRSKLGVAGGPPTSTILPGLVTIQVPGAMTASPGLYRAWATIQLDASTVQTQIYDYLIEQVVGIEVPTGIGAVQQLVDLANSQTITGQKTFTQSPIVPAAAFPESAVANLPTDLAAKALDTAVVHNTGAEAIAGVKTFSSAPVVPAAAFPESAVASLTSDLAAKAADNAVVHLAGTETMSGDKVHSGRLTTAKDFVHSHRVATETELVSGLDASLAETVTVIMTDDRVMAAPINGVDGHRMKVVPIQDGTGNHKLDTSAISVTNWALNLAAGKSTELPIERIAGVWMLAPTQPIAPSQLLPTGTSSGPPIAGTFAIGDVREDAAGGVWVCTTAGTMGDHPLVAAIKADTARGWWRLGDSGLGNTVADSSGNGLTGTPNATGVAFGAASLVPNDPSDKAITFTSAQSGYITIPNANPGSTGQLYLEASIKPTLATAEENLFSTLGSNILILSVLSNGQIRFRAGTGTDLVAPVGTIVAGTTYRITASVDGTGNRRLYVNGQLIAGPTAMSWGTPATTLLLSTTGLNRMDGVMDEAVLGNTALSDTRVLARYNASIQSFTPGVFSQLASTSTPATWTQPQSVATYDGGGTAWNAQHASIGAVPDGNQITDGVMAGGLIDPTLATTTVYPPENTSTDLPAGTYTFVYTFINAAGETKASPSNTKVISANQQIAMSNWSFAPLGATGVNFYLTAAPAGPTLGLIGTITPVFGIANCRLSSQAQGSGVGPPGSNTTGAMTNVLGSASGLFTPALVGLPVCVQCAGVNPGDELLTTFAAYVSPTQMTLAANCGNGVTGAVVQWGTDNWMKLQVGIDKVNAVGGGRLVLSGPWKYFVSFSGATQAGIKPALLIRSGVQFEGVGRPTLLGAGYTSTTQCFFSDAAPAGSQSHWAIRGLVFDGGHAFPEVALQGITLTYASDFEITDNEATRLGSKMVACGTAYSGHRSKRFRIMRNYLHDNPGNGFAMAAADDGLFAFNIHVNDVIGNGVESTFLRDGKGCLLFGNQVVSAGPMLFTDACVDCAMVMNRVQVNPAAPSINQPLMGISVGTAGSTTDTKRILIMANIVDASSVVPLPGGTSSGCIPIRIGTTTGSSALSDVTVVGNSLFPYQSTTAEAIDITQSAGVCSKISVESNRCHGGINVVGGSDIDIVGNRIDNFITVQAAAGACKIRDNTVYGFISSDAAVGGAKITDNTVVDNGVGGYIEAFGGGNQIVGNDVTQSQTANGTHVVNLKGFSNTVVDNIFRYTGAGPSGNIYWLEEKGGAAADDANLIADNQFLWALVRPTKTVGSINTSIPGFNISGVNTVIRGNMGLNPIGNVAAPAVPASGVVLGNPKNVDCTVYVAGGTLTAIGIGGAALPVNAAFATAGTGGTLLNNTPYFYRVTALTLAGETLASAETSITTPAGPDTCTVTPKWSAVVGAIAYKVYGRATGAELLMATVVGANQWLDNGSVTPSGALPGGDTSGNTATGITAAAPAGAVHTLRVPARSSVKYTYSVAPTHTWFAD